MGSARQGAGSEGVPEVQEPILGYATPAGADQPKREAAQGRASCRRNNLASCPYRAQNSKGLTIMPGLNEQASAFGCPDLIHLAGEPTADNLEYLDLLSGRAESPLLPDAVAEFQGRPVMYLVDGGDRRGRDELTADAIRDLQQLLANRSEQSCLAVIRPGSLDVYPINLDRKKLMKFAP